MSRQFVLKSNVLILTSRDEHLNFIIPVEVYRQQETNARVEHYHSHDHVLTRRLSLDWVQTMTSSYSRQCSVSPVDGEAGSNNSGANNTNGGGGGGGRGPSNSSSKTQFSLLTLVLLIALL